MYSQVKAGPAQYVQEVIEDALLDLGAAQGDFLVKVATAAEEGDECLVVTVSATIGIDALLESLPSRRKQ